jgi:positive regulator of sigma E activity
MLVDAVNACGAAIGDEVSIELTSGNFLKAALIMYGLPCAGFMAGIALGYAAAWSLGDARALAAFASGVAGAALAYAYITRAHKNWRVAETKPVAVNIQRKTPQ